MTMMRVAVLALLVACACLVRAAEDAVIVSDIDNNEVLPENDVVRARVDEVPASAPVTTDSPVSSTPPAPTESTAETTQRPDAADKPAEPAEPASTTPASKDAASPTTGAPPRQPSTLGKFLSDIIQIPIAVLRSVGSLLSNTFRGNASGSTSTTPSPAAP